MLQWLLWQIDKNSYQKPKSNVNLFEFILHVIAILFKNEWQYALLDIR